MWSDRQFYEKVEAYRDGDLDDFLAKIFLFLGLSSCLFALKLGVALYISFSEHLKGKLMSQLNYP